MKGRKSTLRRKTKETDIRVDLNLDGTGKYSIRTGLPFLDHMIELLVKHSLIDMTVRATGDLEVDFHHTVEDIGLTIGMAFDKALGNRRGILRYGCGYAPMDEALTRVAIDLGGRPYLVSEMACRKKKILDFDLSLLEDFFRSLTIQGRMNIHIQQFYGDEAHHAYESVFKALALAIRQASERDTRSHGIPSSKGRI